MIVKNVLGNCLVKLGMDDFSLKETLSAAESEIFERLLRCANIIYQEICSCYLPLLHTEQVSLSAEGTLFYDTLQKTVIMPVRLIKDGHIRRFAGGATLLKADFSGAAEFTYAYMPPELAFDSEIVDARLLPWVFEDGICGEYAFEQGMYDLAKAFDEKFRQSVARLKYRGRDVKIKQRRWDV